MLYSLSISMTGLVNKFLNIKR